MPIQFVFEYKKNCFLLEDNTNYRDNDEHLATAIKELYKNCNSPDEIRKFLNIDHEINHLTQDLSFPSSFTEYIFNQYIYRLVVSFPHDGSVTFPLYANNIPTNTAGTKLDINYLMLYEIYHKESIYHALFIQPIKAFGIAEKLGKISNGIINNFNISYQDLLESHAYFKSLFDLCALKSSEKNIIQEVLNHDRLFPIKCEERGKITFDWISFMCRSPYLFPFYLFMEATSLNWGNIIHYINSDFPDYSYPDKIEFVNCYFLYTLVIEAAITIPSFIFIRDKLQDGSYEIETFQPVARFFKILWFIAELNYVDLLTYRTGDIASFIDKLAKKYGWPDYNTTKKSFTQSSEYGNDCFCSMINTTFSIKNSSNALFTMPFFFIESNFTFPIICRTKDKMKITSLTGNDNGEKICDSFYKAYFHNDNSSKGLKYQESLKFVLDNIFIKNIIETELFTGGNFCCPMNNHDCKFRSDFCNDIDTRTNLKKHIDNISLSIGKPAKCMFLEFLMNNLPEYSGRA